LGAVSNENIALLRELYAAWGRGYFATAYGFDSEVEFVRVGTGPAALDGVWHGLDEMWTVIVDWLRTWELLKIEAEEFIGLGDRALVLARHTGRGKHSGVPMDREVGDLFTFRAGKIIRYVSYWDRAEAVRAAGLEQ
jgi:ketosteroid isomerase-like protein